MSEANEASPATVGSEVERVVRQVVFTHPDWGYTFDQETARKHLVVGMKYKVESTDVGGFHTNVYLQEFPGVAFNSVLFEDA